MADIRGGRVLYEVAITGADKATAQLKGLGGVMSGMAAAAGALMATAGATTAAIIAFYREAAKLAQIQTEAELKLIQALKNAGIYTDELTQKLLSSAGAIQSMTRFGDEQLLPVFAAFIRSGIRGEEQLNRMVKLTADLSETTGRDLIASQRALMMVLSGNAGILKRFGIFIDEAILKSGDQLKILEAIEAQIGGMAETMGDTFGGKLIQIQNLIGDIKEAFGKALTVNPEVLRALDFVKTLLSAILREIERVGALDKAFSTLATSIIRLMRVLLEFSDIWMNKVLPPLMGLMKINPVVRTELALMGISWDEYESLVKSAGEAIAVINEEMKNFTMETVSAEEKLAAYRLQLMDAQARGEQWAGQIDYLTKEIAKLEKQIAGVSEATPAFNASFDETATEINEKLIPSFEMLSEKLWEYAGTIETVSATQRKLFLTLPEIEPVEIKLPEIEGEYGKFFERLALEWSGGSLKLHDAILSSTQALQTALTQFVNSLNEENMNLQDIGRQLASSLAGIGTALLPGIGQFLAPIAGALAGQLWDWLFKRDVQQDINFHQEIIINIGEGQISERAFWDNLVKYHILPGLRRGGLMPQPQGGAG